MKPSFQSGQHYFFHMSSELRRGREESEQNENLELKIWSMDQEQSQGFSSPTCMHIFSKCMPPPHCTALEYSSHPNPQNMTELPGPTSHTVATQTLKYIQTCSCTSPYVIMCHLLLENTNPSIIYGLKWAVTDAIPLEGNAAFKFKLENNVYLISFFQICIISVLLVVAVRLFGRPKAPAPCSLPTNEDSGRGGQFLEMPFAPSATVQFVKVVCVICIWVYAPYETGLLPFHVVIFLCFFKPPFRL